MVWRSVYLCLENCREVAGADNFPEEGWFAEELENSFWKRGERLAELGGGPPDLEWQSEVCEGAPYPCGDVGEEPDTFHWDAYDADMGLREPGMDTDDGVSGRRALSESPSSLEPDPEQHCEFKLQIEMTVGSVRNSGCYVTTSRAHADPEFGVVPVPSRWIRNWVHNTASSWGMTASRLIGGGQLPDMLTRAERPSLMKEFYTRRLMQSAPFRVPDGIVWRRFCEQAVDTASARHRLHSDPIAGLIILIQKNPAAFFA